MNELQNNKQGDTDNNTGWRGCLISMGIYALVLLLAFCWLHFHYRHKQNEQNEYKKNPFPARKEIVEGFAGIEFPPYRVKETIIETNWFLGDYIDTIKLEFETMPDSVFYNEIEKACEQFIHLETERTTCDYHFWLRDNYGNYFTYYICGQNEHFYDSIQSILISRGVPADFIVGVDRIYSIRIYKDSPEWTVIVGRY